MIASLLQDTFPAGDVSFDPDSVIRQVCGHYGFRFHAVWSLGAAEKMDSRALLASNFRPEALQCLDDGAWWNSIDGLNECIRLGRPVSRPIWSSGDRARHRGERPGRHGEEHQPIECLGVPVHFGQRLGIACLVGDGVCLDSQDTASIQTAMRGIFERLCILRPERAIRLTPRELECLSWTSRGLTSHETGNLLSISEHTVVRHLASATGKLDASNRSQAVAKAIRLGLMD